MLSNLLFLLIHKNKFLLNSFVYLMILVTPFVQYYTCILKLIISAYFIDNKQQL